MTVNRTTTPTTTQANWSVRVWRFLTEPHSSIKDVGERRRAQLLSILSLILVLLFTIESLVRRQSNVGFIALLVITIISYGFSRTKYYQAGAYFFTFGFTSLAYILIFLGTAASFEIYVTSIVFVSLIVASALLPQGGMLVLASLATLATFAAPAYVKTPVEGVRRVGGLVLSVGAILYGVSAFRAGTERARLKEVQDINRALEALTDNLEDRVKERTAELDQLNRLTTGRAAQLQTIAELSQTIAKVQDPNEIFPTAATLISERFGFYHVGIFLINHAREFAVLQATNSEGGKRMLERGHRLTLGTGVVGFAAETGKARIALDVGVDAVFFNNPDLPETRSEVALPLMSGDKAIGVLDVQSAEAEAFTEDNLQTLNILANQVAIALENARLLSEARASATQVREVYNEFVRTEWSRTAKNAEQAGFRYNVGRIEMLEAPLQDAGISSAVETGKLVTNQTNGSEEKRATVAVPVKLRGEVIGVLQIESMDSSRTWRENELSLMEAVAERAALAMENARLFQDARRRAAKEKLISEATSRISGSLNIENILQTTAGELERVLGGSEVLIQFKGRDSA